VVWSVWWWSGVVCLVWWWSDLVWSGLVVVVWSGLSGGGLVCLVCLVVESLFRNLV